METSLTYDWKKITWDMKYSPLFGDVYTFNLPSFASGFNVSMWVLYRELYSFLKVHQNIQETIVKQLGKVIVIAFIDLAASTYDSVV